MNNIRFDSVNELSRRHLLGSLVAAGVGALIGDTLGAQQAPPGPRRIDFHHHFQLAEILAMERANSEASTNPPWSLSRDLEDMDRGGTATAMLSGFIPTTDNMETQRKAARIINEFAARLRSDHPGRFGSFASIPMRGFDVDGALREIEYAADTLRAEGFQLRSSYDDAWLGDARWAAVYDELNRRRAVVHVHPIVPACCSGMSLSRAVPNEGAMIENGTDTTRAIAHMVFSGGARRWANITWVFSHAGGTMPFLIERFFQAGTSAEIVPGIRTKGQDGNQRTALPGNEVLQHLRRFYYDTAQASNPVALGALRKVAGPTQIVFGTDVWYRTTLETAQGLMTSGVFSPAELHAIARGNAERILAQVRA